MLPMEEYLLSIAPTPASTSPLHCWTSRQHRFEQLQEQVRDLTEESLDPIQPCRNTTKQMYRQRL